jgi:hypothetical protein
MLGMDELGHKEGCSAVRNSHTEPNEESSSNEHREIDTD